MLGRRHRRGGGTRPLLAVVVGAGLGAGDGRTGLMRSAVGGVVVLPLIAVMAARSLAVGAGLAAGRPF